MAIVDKHTVADHLAARQPVVWLPSSPDELLFAGIDGGVSGNISVLDRNDQWRVQHVVVGKEKDRNVLDIEGNLLLLRTLAEMAGGVSRLVVVYEAFRKSNDWGTKNIFTCGRHDEFWRVLLNDHGFRFKSVDPKTWQAHCFRGLGKGKPKPKALRFVQNNCPNHEWLYAYPKSERHGIVDAMCIALWARHQQRLGQL